MTATPAQPIDEPDGGLDPIEHLRSGGRDLAADHDLLRPCLRTFQPGGVSSGAEHGDAVRTHRIGETGHQRSLRPNDDEISSDIVS